MAEELQRHGIKFSLDLNKHPKDAVNLSLINAENFKVSEDGSTLISDKTLKENIVIKDKLTEYYGDNSYNIIFCIPTNDEIVLFVISNYIENKHYDLDLFRYNEKLEVCSDSIIPSKYEKIKYYGGKFSGTFTYNVKNELIIAFCEYDSSYLTYLNYGEPLKIINLGYFDVNSENNYTLIIDSNLNPKTFPLCPEVSIPTIIDWSVVNGLSKKGWYNFYIRYKINKYDYTQWFSFGRAFYLDDSEEKTIFKYKHTTKPNDPIWKVTSIISDDTDICKKSIQFKLNNLSDIYESYQIGFICNTKSYTECKITNDIPIDFTTFNLIYKDCINYDYNNLLKIYENYYSVKNIINYNNRLYISNYNTSKITNVHNSIEHKIIDNELKYNTDNIRTINILFNNELKTITLYNNKISVKELFGVKNLYICDKINSSMDYEGVTEDDDYYRVIQARIFRTNNLFFESENFKEFINVYKCSGVNGWNGDWYSENENNSTVVTGRFNSYIRNHWIKRFYIDYIKYYNLINISDYEFVFDSNSNKFYCNELDTISHCITIVGNNIRKYNYNSNDEYVGYYYETISTEYSIKNEYIVLDKKIYDKDVNDNFTLINKQPYNFFIHYIDKYGYITNGFPINTKKYFGWNIIYGQITTFNNKDYICWSSNQITESNNKISHIYVYLDINLQYKDLHGYIDTDIIVNNSIFYVQYLKDEPIFDFKTYDELKHIKFNINNKDENFLTSIVYYYSNIETNPHLSKLIIKDKFKDKTFKELIKIYPYVYNGEYSFNLNNNNIVIPNITGDSLKAIEFNNINIPNEYNSYFISYEQLEKNLLYNGVSKLGSENIKALFYSDSLNYYDTINIGIDINEQLNEVKEIKYNVANSIKDNNEGKSTNLELIFENEAQEGITYLYKIPNKYYESINKTLLRVSEISSNPSIIVTTYGIKHYISPIIINEAFRINAANELIQYDNTNLLEKTPFDNVEKYLVTSYTPDTSKQINNSPKIFKTITNVNEVDNIDNPKAKFYDSYLFLPQDTIDLFKNNALDYDGSCLSIYLNYNENNINQTKFIKTIRRSTFIKNESLENGWRSFESEAYQNVQENKGEITRIEGIGDLLLIHTKDSLFQFDKSNLLMTANKNVQLAQGDTFDVGYKEIFTSPNGYGGLQDKNAAIVGEFGYIWYNNDFNKIYQYNAGSLNVISGNIEFLLNKYNPITCRFVDDKQNKRLIIQFQLKPIIVDGIEKTQILNITYNYDIKSFISFYINDSSNPNILNETYNTKTKFYILENNKVFNGFDKCNAKKISFIINENYSKIKRLNFIKYKLYKRIDSSNNEFNASLPVEGNAMSIAGTRKPYSGYQLRVYNDLCDTGILDIHHDLKIGVSDIVKPYYDLGNFTFNYLRDKTNDKNQIFGNYFIVEFIFEPKVDQEDGVIEFESLEYGISYEEN